MRLVTEYHDEESAVLIIGGRTMPFVQALVAHFASIKQRVIVSSDMPTQISEHISLCFCFTDTDHLDHDTYSLQKLPRVICIISTHQLHEHISHLQMIERHFPRIRFVMLKPGHHPVDDFTKRLLYFTFDTSSSRFLQLESLPRPHLGTPPVHVERRSLSEVYVSIISRPLRFITITILVLILAHFVFLLPLAASSGVLTYLILHRDDPGAPRLIDAPGFHLSERSYQLSQTLYTWSRPGLSLVGITSYPDRALSVVGSGYTLIHTGYRAVDSVSIMSSKILDPQSLSQDQIETQLDSLTSDIQMIDQSLKVIRAQLPERVLAYRDVRSQLDTGATYTSRASQILPLLPAVLGKDSERLYVVFFANNYELRPGGGFIGSFALVKLSHMQVREWKVYDVYDADGQLKARIPPPAAIAKYLSQPFYFLRDSAFTGDFPSNVLSAEDFLSKELGIQQIDGALLLTMKSLEQVVGAVGPLQIAEYDETVTGDNVYLKTQLHAERRSFPGSIQKKDFIDALFTTLMLQVAEPRHALAAASVLEESFTHKLAAGYSKDAAVQQLLDQWFWSGRQLPYKCLASGSEHAGCILNYLYPLEANLGVNKANAFIDRNYTTDMSIEPDGRVKTTFSVRWYNRSYTDLFPGGTYKNYYQLILPPDIQIQTITLDRVLVTDFDLHRDQYTTVGLLVEVAPRLSRTLTVSYTLAQALSPTENELQLMFQKQIGTPTTDMLLRVTKPTSYTMTDSNVAALARQFPIEYNSPIDADKFYYFTFQSP